MLNFVFSCNEASSDITNTLYRRIVTEQSIKRSISFIVAITSAVVQEEPRQR